MEARRFLRRAALRGTLAAGLTAGAAVPARRSGVPLPSAPGAAAALTVGALIEMPVAAIPGVAATAALAARAVRRGEPAGAILTAMASGAAVALATRQSWPVAPSNPAEVIPSHRVELSPSPTGAGITIAVNPQAGSSRAAGAADALREALPDAEVIVLDDPSHLAKVLEEAAPHANAIGVAGGDGSVNTAAQVAVKVGKPLVVVPTGTLNHFARDLGLSSYGDVVEAVREGEALQVDLPNIDGHPFVNTASFGAYTDLVDARAKLENRIGKWPAMVVALVRVLRTSSPCELEIDGRRRKVWMAFIGNCRYHPSGFAPSWRERLDDGTLDVRLVDGSSPFGRTRLVLALLTGRLGRSKVYEQRSAIRVEVRSLDGPLRLAADGETFDGSERFMIEKDGTQLAVYSPFRG
jgi:undecaprenyl-diphosphatase